MGSIFSYLRNLITQRDTLATNLTAMGVSASNDELLDTLVPKVKNISKDANATASEILTGYTAYSAGVKRIGTMANKAGTSTTATGSVLDTNYRLKIPSTGYYSTSSYLAREKTSVLSDLGYSNAIVPKINSFNVSGTYATSTYYSLAEYFFSEREGRVAIIMKGGTSTTYENLYFTLDNNTDLDITLEGISSYDDSGRTAGDYYVAILTGITSSVDITVDMSSRNSSYDYIICDIQIS